jgi:hypothetical protein
MDKLTAMKKYSEILNELVPNWNKGIIQYTRAYMGLIYSRRKLRRAKRFAQRYKYTKSIN